MLEWLICAAGIAATPVPPDTGGLDEEFLEFLADLAELEAIEPTPPASPASADTQPQGTRPAAPRVQELQR